MNKPSNQNSLEDGNTGDYNTGHYNTGDRNTGNRNTGDRNTGYGNTGNRNTGNRNTGNRNTGDRNTGHYNTGDCNTGDCNTGDGNATDNSAGFFCVEEPSVLSFDVPTGMTRAEFVSNFPEYYGLACELSESSDIEFDKYKRIPGITPEKLKVLHQKHRDARS